MKKIFLALIVLFSISVPASFSENRISLNYSFNPENRYSLYPVHSSENLSFTVSDMSAAGFQIEWVHLFNSDIAFSHGFSVITSADFFNKILIREAIQYGYGNVDFGINACVGGTVVFNWDFNEYNSLSLKPGLAFNMQQATGGTFNLTDTYIYFQEYSALLINNVNYNLWFFNSEKCKIGLNINACFGFPLIGYSNLAYMIQSKATYFKESYITFGTDCLTLSAGIGVQF